MLELIVLSVIRRRLLYKYETNTAEFNKRQYNIDKLLKREIDLIEEFLEPYVIDSTSKE